MVLTSEEKWNRIVDLVKCLRRTFFHFSKADEDDYVLVAEYLLQALEREVFGREKPNNLPGNRE